MRMRQAQGLARTCSKNDDAPLKEDLSSWIEQTHTPSRMISKRQLLMAKFNEARGEIQLSDIEREKKILI